MSAEFVKGKSTGIKHAFFTRYGGVSQGAYKSLNVGKHVGDDPENVDKNRIVALKEINVDKSDFVFLGQLQHSNRIQLVDKAAGGMELSDYDSLITDTPGLAIGLSVADCLPIILVDEEAPALAVVHAGWRGLKVKVIARAVEALAEEFAADPSRIKAVIGPSIGPNSYEVGNELKEHFAERYFEEAGNKLLLNLWSIAEDQLAAAGVKRIENLGIDNFGDERFYSHRRSGGTTGRFLSVASL